MIFEILSFGTILTVIGIALLAWIFIIYTSLIRKKNTVKEAFSSIDVQLKKRYNLIPNMLTIANKFMEHEKELFTKITELRNQAIRIPADINRLSQKMEIEHQIKTLIGQLTVTAENYPQLKSDQTMIELMRAYTSAEEYIAAARRYYNAAVKDLNNAVEIFPSSLIASMLGIGKAEFIKAEDFERQTINSKNSFQ